MSKQNRIVHITTVHRPFDVRIFYKELQTLRKAGHGVVLIAGYDSDKVVDGIQIRAIPRMKNPYRRVVSAGYYAMKQALAEDADVYHIHDPELLLWALILRLRGKTVIYDMHENVPFALRHKEWIPVFLRPMLSNFYRLVERVLLHGLPIIFAEKSYKENYLWHGGAEETILNLPMIDELITVDEAKFNTPTVGYIGDVTAQRGSLVTLNALNILKERGTTVEWECIGSILEQHKAELTSYINTHNLQGVRLQGRKIPAEWHPRIVKCHIGLAVLAPVPNHMKSYPTKLFEYMALGLPIIASGFPLYSEIVEGNSCGLVVKNPTDPEELANAIEYLITHPEEAKLMGLNGRETVIHKYRWDVEAQKLLNYYTQFQ
ncbi:MAG: glycosyltransferase [Anaerolineae bacterium]|nr:glycosyltransferase [Anaerolineae bacterium]